MCQALGFDSKRTATESDLHSRHYNYYHVSVCLYNHPVSIHQATWYPTPIRQWLPNELFRGDQVFVPLASTCRLLLARKHFFLNSKRDLTENTTIICQVDRFKDVHPEG